ncbi:hypothetical protein TNCV_4400861 [Trichonephila clavipes]|nr:hypothetical protein TNCV_4400861 [Trichonephila clavipes]
MEDSKKGNGEIVVFTYAGYTRAFGDEPRNFEPWSSDVDDI